MGTQSTEPKKSFLQNDPLLVCGMLAIYGICILGCIGIVFLGLNRSIQSESRNATGTAVAFSTREAQISTPASARFTEQAHYDLIETFDSNKNRWRTGNENSEFWTGGTEIANGVYRWEVNDTKKTFMSWAEYPVYNYMRDFDVYVDTKIVDTKVGAACSGFLFRISPQGWEQGGYYFGVCNDSTAKVFYRSDTDIWESILNQKPIQYSNDWNRLEINARGSHFLFFVNGKLIYEMDDKRWEAGALALTIELSEKEPAVILFDNFGFQNR